MTTQEKVTPQAGLTGGFHYGTIYAPCNGVYQLTDRLHDDGRQIYQCDACGAQAVMKWSIADPIAAASEGGK